MCHACGAGGVQNWKQVACPLPRGGTWGPRAPQRWSPGTKPGGANVVYPSRCASPSSASAPPPFRPLPPRPPRPLPRFLVPRQRRPQDLEPLLQARPQLRPGPRGRPGGGRRRRRRPPRPPRRPASPALGDPPALGGPAVPRGCRRHAPPPPLPLPAQPVQEWRTAARPPIQDQGSPTCAAKRAGAGGRARAGEGERGRGGGERSSRQRGGSAKLISYEAESLGGPVTPAAPAPLLAGERALGGQLGHARPETRSKRHGPSWPSRSKP